MLKKIVAFLIVMVFSVFLCSCARYSDKDRKVNFEEFINQNEGLYDLIKDEKIVIKDDNDDIDISKIYDSVETSLITLKKSNSDTDILNLYIIKKSECINISLIEDNDLVFSYDIKRSDIDELINSNDANESEVSFTVSELINEIEESFDFDVKELLNYDFKISDFDYDAKEKLFVMHNDALIAYAASIMDKFDPYFPEGLYIPKTIDEINSYLDREKIDFSLSFGFEKTHITKLVFTLHQNLDLDVEHTELDVEQERIKDSFANVLLDFEYDSDDKLKGIEFSCDIFFNELEDLNSDMYLDQYMVREQKTKSISKNLDLSISGHLREDDISILGTINTTDEIQSILNSEASETKKASSTEYSSESNEIKLDISYKDKVFKMNLDVSGELENELSGTYLIVKTTQIGSYISLETKVASYGSSDNYKFSYNGGIDLEYNKEGRIVLEINLEGIDEHKEKCIDLNGKVDFGDFINELTFSSMCKIKALNQYKILNSELVYSKITEDEIPDINDNEDTLLK